MSMDQGPITPTVSNNYRPRPRSRGLSWGSGRSGESPQEKARRDSIWKATSKANPNAAIIEAQPGVANLIEQSTLQNLRDFQHKDTEGNIIVDPDLSNPTRPRLERPLDTIRSFEKAIDDGYKRRSTFMRQDAEQYDQNNQYASRRSSYFGGHDNSQNGNRFSQAGGGYYGNQQTGGTQRMRYGNRMQSEPQMYGGRPYNPQHAYQSSHDTVNTGLTNGSDSTGPWGNSTDPSSENSSLDRVAAMNKPGTPGMDGYGPYGNGPIMEEQGRPDRYGEYPPQPPQHQTPYGGQNNGYGQGPPRSGYQRHNSAPMSPPQGGRRPIPLGGGNAGIPGALPSAARTRPEPEKRKSWLKRAFSKKE